VTNKSRFEKASAIVVILYFSYFLFFIKIEKEIMSLYERFWLIVKGNSASIIIFFLLVCFIVAGFINWILEEDNVKKVKKKIEKKEEKQEKAEE
jgi:hypothetical protein